VEARDLVRLGHHAAAVSRAYYATFYACQALLKSVNIEARTHDGVHTMVAQHFVRPGKLAPETSRLLKHLEGDRELADYDFAFSLTEAEADEVVDDATRFVEAAAAVLASPA
jgi:uncharacterized protein (UPF0332 family)